MTLMAALTLGCEPIEDEIQPSPATITPSNTVVATAIPTTILFATPVSVPTLTPVETLVPTPTPVETPVPTPTPTVAPVVTGPTPTVPSATLVPQPTPQVEDFFLRIENPAVADVVIDSDSLRIRGVTRPDAQVTVDGALASLDDDGRFEAEVKLVDDNKVVEIVATAPSGERQVRTIRVSMGTLLTFAQDQLNNQRRVFLRWRA